jgi:hypothetical protein
MELDVSLPRPQEPATGPYPELNRSSPYNPVLLLYNSFYVNLPSNM